MSGLISLYLDLFRLLAAVTVFFSHAEQHSAARGVLPTFHFDHKLVIIFFVISGYVIGASTARPTRTLANYCADRLARLYSVLIPALIFTYCVDAIGARVSPDVYANISPHWQPLRFVVNLFYCQQLWGLCVNPSTNAPLWSLSYEFWFYVLFGIWVFIRVNRVKYLLLLAASLIIGPKILLLFPAWVAGGAAFRLGKSWKCSYRASILLFILSGIAFFIAITFERELGLTNQKSGLPPLYYSSDFIGDNIFAVITAFHFLCCALLSKHLTVDFKANPAGRLIHLLASHTFSLYAFHMPFLYFMRAIFKYDLHNLWAIGFSLALALVIIAGLSKITEEQYPALRNFSRAWMSSFLDKVRPAAVKRKLVPAPK